MRARSPTSRSPSLRRRRAHRRPDPGRDDAVTAHRALPSLPANGTFSLRHPPPGILAEAHQPVEGGVMESGLEGSTVASAARPFARPSHRRAAHAVAVALAAATLLVAAAAA